MGQTFYVVNRGKMQYLNNQRFPCPDKIRQINNTIMSAMISNLVVSSKNPAWEKYKTGQDQFYAQKYLGSWFGDEIELLGDYDDSSVLHELVHSTYEDITIEMIAALFESSEETDKIINCFIEGDNEYIDIFSTIAEFPNPPRSVIFAVEKRFGKRWKKNIYDRKKW